MSEAATKCEAPKHHVDERDMRLLDLLLRAAVTLDATVVDPSREALVMRELARQWRSDVPATVGLNLYRQALGAALRRHSPVSLHVAADHAVGELARAHFGFSMPLTVHPTASMVVQALVEDRLAIGIAPVPVSDARQPGWWSNLASPSTLGPRIVAKLPFFQNDGSAVRHPPSYVLASVPTALSGDDTTLVVVFLRAEMSRAKLAQALKMATLDAQIVAMGHDQPERTPRRYLVEAAGFLGPADPRLNALQTHGGEEIADIALVGAYANPVLFGRERVS